jgi:hypothetical protein
MSLPVSAWEHNASLNVRDHEVPLTYNPLLLSLGISVYADLLVARQAALNYCWAIIFSLKFCLNVSELKNSTGMRAEAQYWDAIGD